MTIETEVREQRERNHRKWGVESIENRPPEYAGWLPTLVEEVGEMARAMQEGDLRQLRAESIDALAVCWMLVDAIDKWCPFEAPPGGGYVCYRCGREFTEHRMARA